MTVLDTTTTRRWIRPATIGVAVLAALVLWIVLVPVAGLELAALQGPALLQVDAVSVAVATAVVGLLGWGLLALLERRSASGLRYWTIVAACVCVLSTGDPLINGVTLGAKLGLAALHLVVGLVVIVGFRRGQRR
ncbi:DUF6069 family protein [Pseudonocardia sp. GCM10023141]|uniref:DUF6069 family protein n=1 Tax=Pseudonocardia sp. GCM10023141 TaxID=3252653 RepID=UPI0036123788